MTERKLLGLIGAVLAGAALALALVHPSGAQFRDTLGTAAVIVLVACGGIVGRFISDRRRSRT